MFNIFKLTKKRLESIFDSTLSVIISTAIISLFVIGLAWLGYDSFKGSIENSEGQQTAIGSAEILAEQHEADLENVDEGASPNPEELPEKAKLDLKSDTEKMPPISEPEEPLKQIESETFESENKSANDQDKINAENLLAHEDLPKVVIQETDPKSAEVISETQTNEEIKEKINYTDYNYTFSQFRTIRFWERRSSLTFQNYSRAIFWDFTINIQKLSSNDPGRCRLDIKLGRNFGELSFRIKEKGSEQEWFEWGNSNQLTLTIISVFGTNYGSDYIKKNLLKDPPTFKALCEGDAKKEDIFQKIAIFFE